MTIPDAAPPGGGAFGTRGRPNKRGAPPTGDAPRGVWQAGPRYIPETDCVLPALHASCVARMASVATESV